MITTKIKYFAITLIIILQFSFRDSLYTRIVYLIEKVMYTVN